MPQDRYGCFNGYCDVVFQHECTVPYALELFEDTELFGKFLKLRTRSSNYHKSCLASSVSNYADMDFDALLQLSKDKLNAEASGTGSGLPQHSGSKHHLWREPMDEKKSQNMRDQDNRLVEENCRRSDYHHSSGYHHSRRERESYSRHRRHGSRNQLHNTPYQDSHDFELSNRRHRDKKHPRRRSRDKYHNDHGDRRSVGETRSNEDRK